MTNFLKEYELPESICVGCGHKLDRLASVFGHMPEPGDLTVCAECGTLLKFGPDMILAQADESEIDSLEPPQRRELMRAAIKHFKEKRKNEYPNGEWTKNTEHGT